MPLNFAGAQNNNFVTALNDHNIKMFLEGVSAIATGKNDQMLDEDVVNFFDNHIADHGKFKSAMRYDIPGFPTRDIDVELKKEDYINSIVKGRYTMRDYETTIMLQDLEISNRGQRATFTSITEEKGQLPFPRNLEKPDEVELLPITGKSICDQVLRVSRNNFVQMISADCRTEITFDPFEGRPLIPQ